MIKCLNKIETKKIITLDKNLYYNFNSLELFEQNHQLPLGQKENLLLQLLLENKDRVLSREELEHHIWSKAISDSAIKNLIGSLRTKIGKDKIINISRIGWKIN